LQIRKNSFPDTEENAMKIHPGVKPALWGAVAGFGARWGRDDAKEPHSQVAIDKSRIEVGGGGFVLRRRAM